MSEALPKSQHLTLAITMPVISSPVLVFGQQPTTLNPGASAVGKSGQDHAHVNHSALQGVEMGLMMSATYGRYGNVSSRSASLQSSLVSRLQANLQTRGSTLYLLIWKPWITPAGRLLFRQRASVPRISGTEFTGWVTPTTRDWKDTPGMTALRNWRERLDQLPRIVFGRESQLWSCIGPGDSLAYGTSPKDAYNNWRTMHGSALEGSTG